MHALFRLKTECEIEGLHQRAGFDAWVSLANEVLGGWRPKPGAFVTPPDRPDPGSESEEARRA